MTAINKGKSVTLRITYAALFLALGVMLPQAFHVFGAGSVFLPMHIPVIIGGFVCGAYWGIAIGVGSVLVSSAVFAMPGFTPFGYAMIFELAAYGFFAGLFYQKVFAKMNDVGRIYFSLIAAMLLGRVVSIIAKWLIFSLFGTEFAMAMILASLFITAWPGIVVQIVAIPIVMLAMKKTKMVK